MAKFEFIPPPDQMVEHEIPGVGTILIPGDGILGFGAGNDSAGYTYIDEDGDIQCIGDIVLASGGTVDGVVVSEQNSHMIRGVEVDEPELWPTSKSLLVYNNSLNQWVVAGDEIVNGGDCSITWHFHSTDRARANHTGTQLSSTISDFEHKCFHGVTDSDISTNGTTAVDITWDGIKINGFTHSDGTAGIEIDQDGEYLLSCTLYSDYNNADQTMAMYPKLDEGSGYAAITNAYRYQHTSSYQSVQVVLCNYFISLNDGDKIKIQGAFSAADAGSVWKSGRCNICLLKIDGA